MPKDKDNNVQRHQENFNNQAPITGRKVVISSQEFSPDRASLTPGRDRDKPKTQDGD